jgi:hypothetical protein
MLQMSSSSDYERHKNNNNSSSSSSSSGRNSRNKKKGAPFMFFTNILKKKKVLSIDEIKEMKTRTRSEPSGESHIKWTTSTWGHFYIVEFRHMARYKGV